MMNLDLVVKYLGCALLMAAVGLLVIGTMIGMVLR